MFAITDLPQVITAVGGLGTAAFGLVDSTKVAWGGVNRIGFGGIRKAVVPLTPAPAAAGAPSNALSQTKILDTLQANWFNGNDLASQKAIAKSLIKLNMSAANAGALATATGVDAAVLAAVATSTATGQPLTAAQQDVYGRFDLIVTALLDEAYQRSDQFYRNWTRGIAGGIAVVLALFGGWMANIGLPTSLLVGVLAVPLAPIAKDLSTALATAVNTLQLIKK